MVKQDRYYGVDRYLPHAVLATAAVVAIPLMLVVALLMVLDGDLAPLLAAVVGAALALIVAGIGSLLWSRASGSLDVSFGELLIWGWMRRKRAEERAARDARLLGLDNEGRPAERARSARSQQLSILGDLSTALESKDPYTHGHSQRVERHAIRTAVELGLDVKEIADLRRAAALHDVGKIRIPHRILRKPGSLTPEERRVIQQHSVVGAWLVSNVCSPSIVAAVRGHHERWDGRGYPDNLSGLHIPLYARIIAVADAFDAMTSTRPYRVAYDSRTAIEILEAEAGAQFDPEVVRAFVATVPNRVPLGAFFPFLGAGFLRKAAGGLRRAIRGTAMSGAAGAGAAAVLVASVLSPVDAPLARPDRDAAAPAYGPAVPDATEFADLDEPSNERKAEGRAVQKAVEGDDDVETTRTARNKLRTVVLGTRITRDSGGADLDEAPAGDDDRDRRTRPDEGGDDGTDREEPKEEGPSPSTPPKDHDGDDDGGSDDDDGDDEGEGDDDAEAANGVGKGHSKHSDKGNGKKNGKGHQKYGG